MALRSETPRWIASARLLAPVAALAAAVLFLDRWFDDPAVELAGGLRISAVWPWALAVIVLTGVTTTVHRDRIEQLGGELVGALSLGRRALLLLAVVVAVSFVFQLPTMFFPSALMHSDAAINGLMAIHIAEGRVAPAFYYGQEFMGTLFSHALGALFVVTGPFVAGTSLMTWCFWVGFLVATFLLVRLAASTTVGFATALWLAIPPAAMITTLAQTEYAQLFLLAGWGLWLTGACLAGRLQDRAWWAVAGFVLGLAFWAHPMASFVAVATVLSLMVLLPAGDALRAVALLAVGWGIGVTPALVGWGGRLGRFVEWFLEGGGRGGHASMQEAIAGLVSTSFSNLLLGTEYRSELPSMLAVPFALLLVGSAAWLVLAGIRLGIAARRGYPTFDETGGESGLMAGGGPSAAAGLPLGLFVLVQVGVLAGRGYDVPPAHYVAPLLIGVPGVVAIALYRSTARRSRHAGRWVAAVILLWAAIPLPSSIAWLRTLPADQASMNASLAGLQAAGVDTCIGPYWDAYRIAYLTLEAIVCESVDVRRVPGYRERVAERTRGRRPAFVAAPQRDAALQRHRAGWAERGIPWTLVKTSRFSVLVPGR